jgi:hypothetical protein
MKIIVSIKLRNGMELTLDQDVKTFSDLKKLGAKVAKLPGDANKLIPGIADCPVDGLGIKKEQAAAAA